MDEDTKYPEKVQPGMNVKYALNEDDPEEKWEESTVESVQDQPSFVPKGTFCRFVNFRLGYVKKILKLRELSKKMISDLINSTEGKEIERKTSFLVDETKVQRWWLKDQVVKEVAAFMNTEGGYVIIGQKDGGEVVGIDLDLQVIQNRMQRSDSDVVDKYISEMEDYIFKKINDTRLNRLVEIIPAKTDVGGVEKQICIIYVSKDKNGIPALIDIDIQIINTRDDHFKEKDINNDPTADATSTHAWKNTELKAKIYYVRLNQKTVAEDIRKLFTNQI